MVLIKSVDAQVMETPWIRIHSFLSSVRNKAKLVIWEEGLPRLPRYRANVVETVRTTLPGRAGTCIYLDGAGNGSNV